MAAVVGSLNATATRYAARISQQTGRTEIIADLKEMVRAEGGLTPARVDLGLGVIPHADRAWRSHFL